MKTKILLAVAISACSASTLLHAGSMGAPKKPTPFLIPFLAGEGMYTWPQVDGYSVDILNATVQGQTQNIHITSSNENQGWGGRLAGGLMHPMSGRFESFSGTVEAGWGYYGSMDLNPIATGSATSATVAISTTEAGMSMKQYGVDLLAGLVYDQPKYDVFFKVGALIQNLKLNVHVDPQKLERSAGIPIPVSGIGAVINGNYSRSPTVVNILPMLRLGGGYRISKNVLATASWMHAFGSTLKVNMPDIDSLNRTAGNISAKIASPSLDAAMLGLEYRFG